MLALPASIHGRTADVKRRLSRTIGPLTGGVSIGDALDARDLLAVDDHPGLIVLDGPSPLLAGSPHFHAYLPWSIVEEAAGADRVGADVVERVFAESLETSWGTLGLLAQKNVMWVFPAHRHEPFLASVARDWPELDSAGARYTVGSTDGDWLWTINQNLKFVLANHGVDAATLSLPLRRDQILRLVWRVLGALRAEG